MKEAKIIKLTELPYKQKAIIKSFGQTELYVKLLEMGCIPDEEISVELTAPLGDPIAINVAGYNLSLRNNEAENIMVEVIGS
jgi:ferrous iron transport protein A